MAILLIEDTLWAKKQLATSLESYDDAAFVKMILSFANLYNLTKLEMSASLTWDPRTILSGFNKSLMAVPSAKNYGLLVTTYLFLFSGMDTLLITLINIFAVPIGTVDFSTMIRLFFNLVGLLL